MNRLLLIIPLLLLLVFGDPAYSAETGCIEGDCVNGTGTYVFSSGSRYEGQWKDDTYDGQVGCYNLLLILFGDCFEGIGVSSFDVSSVGFWCIYR